MTLDKSTPHPISQRDFKALFLDHHEDGTEIVGGNPTIWNLESGKSGSNAGPSTNQANNKFLVVRYL